MPTKDHIIREIRRVAVKIGRSPGQRVFRNETGICKPEWYGVHFARWGDALRAAGYEPNAMRGRLASEQVIRKYAEAVRYFGRIPTVIEVRMYARNRPDFPGHSTFGNHFGNKKGLVVALAKLVRDDHEFADLAALLPELIQDAASDLPKDGSVYLIRSGNHYKIGRSDRLERRVQQIGIAPPEQTELEHTIRTDDPPGIEAYWHRRFAARRSNGEWFRLTKADVRAFRRRRFQ